VGDVFFLPIAADRVSVGQVAWRRQPGVSDFLMVIYEGVYPSKPPPDIDAALAKPICLQAITLPTSLKTGRWSVVGTRSVPADRVLMPSFKVMTRPPDQYDVVDFTGRTLHRASPREAQDLDFATSIGPNLLEHAAQAFAGLTPFGDDLAFLLPPSGGQSLERTTSPRRRPWSVDTGSVARIWRRILRPSRPVRMWLDRRTAEHVTTSGTTAKQPRMTDHYLYFRTQPEARAAAAALARPFRAITVRSSAAGSNWLVLVEQLIDVEIERITALRREFEAATTAPGAYYDGWGSVVGSAQE
jgi:hypothetical protein